MTKVDINAEKWDKRFLSLAYHVGQWSKDQSARTGSVIVGADRIVRTMGYNGLVRGANDHDRSRHQRPEKYLWSEHAERNAIYNAARLGLSVDGCTIYVNWFPCGDCARAVVQSGIVRIVGLAPDVKDSKWGADFDFSKRLFEEVGVIVTLYDIPELAARVDNSK
jgi:dCMP deaminase